MPKKRTQRPARALAARPEVVHPSERQCSHFLKMGKIFARSQFKRTSHPNLTTKLTTMYEELPLKEFTLIFTTCLKVPFKVLEKNPGVDRTLEFAANFCIEINKLEDECGTGDMCPFFESVMNFLLDNSCTDLPACRFRICQLINMVMSNLGQNVELDHVIADKIMNSMLERLKDKTPSVRSQAVVALQRLQDPSDSMCQVVQEFLYHMENDPSPEVRSMTLRCVARSSHTIPLIVARTLDTKDTIRRNAQLVLAKIHIKSLRIAFREDVIKRGLNDRSVTVRECTKSILLPSWFACVDKDFIKFLECLDVSTTESSTAICQMALATLLNLEPLDEVMSYAIKQLHNKMMPLKNLWQYQENKNTAEKVFFWGSLVQHLRTHGLDDHVDSIMPDLTPFCQYIKQLVLEGTAPEEIDEFEDERRTFVIRQLMKMAGEYDLSDEMGRSMLCILVEQMIVSSDVNNSMTPDLIALLVKIEPNVNARMQKLAELISDIHVPLNPASQGMPILEGEFKELTMKKGKLRFAIMEKETEQENAVGAGDFRQAEVLKTDIAELRLTLDQVNQALSTADRGDVVRQESNDDNTLIQCLTVVYEMMQSPTVVTLTPQLRSLMQDFVLRFYDNERDIQVQILCLKCYGAFCLLDAELAKQRISFFFMQLADGDENSEVCVVTLQIIFDLFFFYGLETFGIVDNLDIATIPRARPYSDIIDIPCSGDSVSSVGHSRENSVLKTMYNIFNDTECPLLHPVTAMGFCKLLLAGRINSYRLLSRLVLAWYDPATTDDTMKKTIGHFLTAYTSNCPSALPLMVQVFLPTLDFLMEASPESSFATVDIRNVILLLISLTRPGINPHFDQNVHDNLAMVICDRILADSKAEVTSYLIHALTMLQFTLEGGSLLDNLMDKARQVKKRVLNDKALLKSVNLFIDMLEKMEHERSESEIDAPSVSGSASVAGSVGTNDSHANNLSDATSMMDSISLTNVSSSTKISLPATRITKSRAPTLCNIVEDQMEQNQEASSSSLEHEIESSTSSSSPDRKRFRPSNTNIVIPESQSGMESEEDIEELD